MRKKRPLRTSLPGWTKPLPQRCVMLNGRNLFLKSLKEFRIKRFTKKKLFPLYSSKKLFKECRIDIHGVLRISFFISDAWEETCLTAASWNIKRLHSAVTKLDDAQNQLALLRLEQRDCDFRKIVFRQQATLNRYQKVIHRFSRLFFSLRGFELSPTSDESWPWARLPITRAWISLPGIEFISTAHNGLIGRLVRILGRDDPDYSPSLYGGSKAGGRHPISKHLKEKLLTLEKRYRAGSKHLRRIVAQLKSENLDKADLELEIKTEASNIARKNGIYDELLLQGLENRQPRKWVRNIARKHLEILSTENN